MKISHIGHLPITFCDFFKEYTRVSSYVLFHMYAVLQTLQCIVDCRYIYTLTTRSQSLRHPRYTVIPIPGFRCIALLIQKSIQFFPIFYRIKEWGCGRYCVSITLMLLLILSPYLTHCNFGACKELKPLGAYGDSGADTSKCVASGNRK